MTNRFDLYKNVHKGIRRELGTLLLEAGSVEPTDVADIARVADRWVAARAVLESHHHHEDAHIAPHFARLAPVLGAELDAEHESLHASMDTLSGHATAMRTGAVAASHAFYLELGAFVARYFLHMDKEERAGQQALERAYSDADIAGIENAIVSSLSPDESAAIFSRMLPAMNPSERESLLRDVRDHAPPFVFEGMWLLAKSSLDEAAFRALESRFGVPIAA